MKQLNRSTKFKRKTIRIDFLKADYPELEEDTFAVLQEMMGTERNDYEINSLKEEEVKDTNGKKAPTFRMRRTIKQDLIRERLIVLCLIDETGAYVYGDDEAHLLAADYPASIIITLHEAAQKLNGLATEPEEAEKNSESDRQGDSTSASPLH